jgi:glycosyltransferase involved in cell wall biosynthesis
LSGASRRPLLSAALIVRDEERFLPRCLASVKDLVDEIVVVDTGSIDRSREIAGDFGARVHEFAWIDDFAAARNESLGHAAGDWILYIDADEAVQPVERAALQPLLEDGDAVGHYVMLQPRPGFTAYRELRLFRNHASIRFRGAIHENIWPAVRRYQARHGGHIHQSPLVLEHLGYEGDQRRKHLRNLPLLEKRLARRPQHVFSWCHLARIRLALGEGALAEQAWTRALDIVRKKKHDLPEDSLPYAGLVDWQVSQGRDARPLLAEGRRLFPDNVQLEWLEARILMMEGRFAEAVPLFERFVRIGETGEHDRTISYDIRLFGVLAYDALATCFFRLGKYGESRRYYELAARAEPATREYAVKRDLSAHLERSGGPP